MYVYIKSSEKSHYFKEKTQYLMKTLYDCEKRYHDVVKCSSVNLTNVNKCYDLFGVYTR